MNTEIVHWLVGNLRSYGA